MTGARRRQLETTYLGRCVGMIAARVTTVTWSRTASSWTCGV